MHATRRNDDMQRQSHGWKPSDLSPNSNLRSWLVTGETGKVMGLELHEPSSQPPWPAPVASTMVRGLEPPFDDSHRATGSPRRRRLAVVAAVLVLLAAVAG